MHFLILNQALSSSTLVHIFVDKVADDWPVRHDTVLQIFLPFHHLGPAYMRTAVIDLCEVAGSTSAICRCLAFCAFHHDNNNQLLVDNLKSMYQDLRVSH